MFAPTSYRWPSAAVAHKSETTTILIHTYFPPLANAWEWGAALRHSARRLPLGHAGLGQPLRLPELHGESEGAHVATGRCHFVHRVPNRRANIHVDDRKGSSIPSPIDGVRVGKSKHAARDREPQPVAGGEAENAIAPRDLNLQRLAASRFREKPLALRNAAVRQNGVDLRDGSGVPRATDRRNFGAPPFSGSRSHHVHRDVP